MYYKAVKAAELPKEIGFVIIVDDASDFNKGIGRYYFDGNDYLWGIGEHRRKDAIRCYRLQPCDSEIEALDVTPDLMMIFACALEFESKMIEIEDFRIQFKKYKEKIQINLLSKTDEIEALQERVKQLESSLAACERFRLQDAVSAIDDQNFQRDLRLKAEARVKELEAENEMLKQEVKNFWER